MGGLTSCIWILYGGWDKVGTFGHVFIFSFPFGLLYILQSNLDCYFFFLFVCSFVYVFLIILSQPEPSLT